MFSVEIKKNAILDYFGGLPMSRTMTKYGIKGSATVYEWIRRFKALGLEGLADHSFTKTYYDYSFKMKVIRWRLEHNTSYPVTAKFFNIRHPSMIWQWERALESGHLQPNKGRSSRMPDKPDKQSRETNKKLQEENDYLRVRVAYLEKLHALAQKKKQSQTKKKPS